MIRSLRLENFRCFERAAVDLPEEGAVFVGRNAQGKTSLLEAVCVLLRLQSPRTRTLSHLVKKGSAGFGVAGAGAEFFLKARGEKGELELSVDGEAAGSRADYLGKSGLVVWIGNDDLGLVRGGGELRRRYLDFTASQMEGPYLWHWSRYRRALRARNQLLKTKAAGSAEVRAYTRLLVEHGTELVAGRVRLCEALTPLVAENHAEISGRTEEIGLVYVDRAGGDLEKAFAEAAERETRRGMTLAGPHRDELALKIGGAGARDFGSEGQQRTLALALKLGQGQLLLRSRGESPVYLIDDIFGELDLERRRALMRLLPGGAQKLITTTNLDWEVAGAGKLRRFEVEGGRVEGG